MRTAVLALVGGRPIHAIIVKVDGCFLVRRAIYVPDQVSFRFLYVTPSLGSCFYWYEFFFL